MARDQVFDRPVQREDVSEHGKLYQYLSEREDQLVRIVRDLRQEVSDLKATRPLGTDDFMAVREALQSGGEVELSVHNLPGLTAEPQDVNHPRITTLPDAYQYPFNEVVVIGSGSTPDTIYQIDRSQTPYKWVPIGAAAVATAPGPFLTTSTVQSVLAGATKSFRDDDLILQDDGDPTKQFKFQADVITAGQTRVLTVQDANYTIAGRNITEDASGRVGIGVVPTSRLEVLGGSGSNVEAGVWESNATWTALSLNGDMALGANFYSAPSQPLIVNRPTGQGISFRENNTEQVLLFTGGALAMRSGNALRLYNSDNSNFATIATYGTAPNAGVSLTPGGGVGLIIDNAGKANIGGGALNHRFIATVNDSGATAGITGNTLVNFIAENTNAAVNTKAGIGFSVKPSIGSYLAAVWAKLTNATTGAASLNFSTYSGSTWNDPAMVLDASGNLGIGVAPSYVLDILKASGNASINVVASSTTGVSNMDLSCGDGTTSSRLAYFRCGSIETSGHSWQIGMVGTKDLKITSAVADAIIVLSATSEVEFVQDVSFDRTDFTITGNTDNLAIGSTGFVRLTGTPAAFNLTGVTGGRKGRMLILQNQTGVNCTLVHDATSTAANRFWLRAAANYVLASSTSTMFAYDDGNSRWVQING